LLLLFCANAFAALESSWSSQIHGFLNQAYSLSSDNNFYGDSQENGSFDSREIGINVSNRFNQNILLAGQILSSKSGDTSDSDPKVDFLLLDFRIREKIQHRAGIQIGRIKNPFGFYNETRDVPITRPSVLLPQSIYFDRTRDLTLSSDGVQLYGSVDVSNALLRWQLQAAYPRINSNRVKGILNITETDSEFRSKLSYIYKMSYEQAGRGLNLALSLVQLNSEYHRSSAIDGSFQFMPRIFSFQYNTLNWILSSEYARRPFFFDNLPLALPIKRLEGESYYLQFTWLNGERLNSYIRYDATYLDREDKDGSQYETMTAGFYPAYTRYALDKTLGLRWMISHAWEAGIENHWIAGTAWLFAEENPTPSAMQKNWRLLMANVSYRF